MLLAVSAKKPKNYVLKRISLIDILRKKNKGV